MLHRRGAEHDPSALHHRRLGITGAAAEEFSATADGRLAEAGQRLDELGAATRDRPVRGGRRGRPGLGRTNGGRSVRGRRGFRAFPADLPGSGRRRTPNWCRGGDGEDLAHVQHVARSAREPRIECLAAEECLRGRRGGERLRFDVDAVDVNIQRHLRHAGSDHRSAKEASRGSFTPYPSWVRSTVSSSSLVVVCVPVAALEWPPPVRGWRRHRSVDAS